MSESEYKIRKATLEDLPILLDYEQEIIKAERPFDPTIRDGKINYYDIEQMIKGDDAHVVVAVCNDAIIASGYALAKRARHYLDHEYYSYLGFMFTDVGHRGRGVNSKIVEELKKWSYDNGYKEIRLTVYNDNVPAIKAYEKVGFKRHIIEMRLK